MYLDTSTLVKLIRIGAESDQLGDWLDERTEIRWITSALAEVELPRVIRAVAPKGLSAVSSVLTRVNRFDIDPRIRSTAAAYPDPALRSMLAAVALRRSYVAGRPIVDTMDAAEHLRSALHVYTTPAAPALGIDAYAQQVYEANLETLTGPLSAGDDHDNP